MEEKGGQYAEGRKRIGSFGQWALTCIEYSSAIALYEARMEVQSWIEISTERKLQAADSEGRREIQQRTFSRHSLFVE